MMNEIKKLFKADKRVFREQWMMWLGTRMSIDFGLFLLRMGIGVMMLIHGVNKVQMLYRGEYTTFADPLGIGVMASLILCVFAEVVCSVLLMLGFLTRLATVVLILNMSVALFIVLGLSVWGAQELAAVYLLIYLVLLYTGPGNISLDALWIHKKWNRRNIAKRKI